MTNNEIRLSHNLSSRNWAKKHKDKCNLMRKEWTRKRMVWFNEFKKGYSCSVCGESATECLDFHHRDPTVKKFVIQRLVTRTSDNNKVLEEIAKCDVFCANCHRKHHFKSI